MLLAQPAQLSVSFQEFLSPEYVEKRTAAAFSSKKDFVFGNVISDLSGSCLLSRERWYKRNAPLRSGEHSRHGENG
jgi:hypothetical protein